MTNPVIWLGLSILLLALGLALLVCVSIPALLGLARAARSAEKLFDTLDRELPHTLQAMRNTGQDLSGLADDMTDSVNSARNIVKQVDHSLSDVRQQAHQLSRTTHSVVVGFRAAWRVLTKPTPTRAKRPRKPPVKPTAKPSSKPPASKNPVPKSPPGSKDRTSDRSSDASMTIDD
ncbi:DUF948 domain-containing protein [Leptothoe sp. PORK10 BA2]|uniref:DUF948 domain-containing protein n=1 Tax=Leptothoe sp. PORK10 BA2 TaxID=3110254 RepID=UPI002B200B2D|nr:DUF948 domain-containing protein [Leptothoe sp. PORK10 BA2]MEA5463242.1 DUF948 domain-containing protein [Leptothoe sp. PORK10 BA2]